MGQDRDFKIVNGRPRLKASYIMRADPRAYAGSDRPAQRL
jgi:hypothetical protein